jgi:hypothetical protein
MKKILPFVLPVLFLCACGEEKKTVVVRHRPAKVRSENPEQFRTIEKPSSYSGQ